MKKLEWYKDTGYGQTELAVDEAPVWRTTYQGKEGTFDLEVYPLKLIDKDLKGWEYRITEDNGDDEEDEGTEFDFDSGFEAGSGNHAPTAKVAMKWAEATLEDILEERRAKK